MGVPNTHRIGEIVLIRDIVPQDRELFLELAEEFYHSPGVLHPVPHHYLENTFNQMISQSPFVKGWILMEGEEPAGYGLASCTWSNESGGMIAWLEELYIRPQFQGHGLGGAYFRFFEERYGKDLTRIRLEIEPNNDGARRLYARLGYQQLRYEQMYKEFGAKEG